MINVSLSKSITVCTDVCNGKADRQGRGGGFLVGTDVGIHGKVRGWGIHGRTGVGDSWEDRGGGFMGGQGWGIHGRTGGGGFMGGQGVGDSWAGRTRWVYTTPSICSHSVMSSNLLGGQTQLFLKFHFFVLCQHPTYQIRTPFPHPVCRIELNLYV